MSRPPVSTPAGWRLVALCSAMVGALSLAVVVRLPLPALGMPAAALAAVLLALRAVRWRWFRFAVLLAVCCLAGAARGASAAGSGGAALEALSGPATLIGTVRDGTGARRSAAQVVVDVDRVVAGDVDRGVRAGVLATLRAGPDVLPGDRVQLDVRGLRPPGDSGPGAVLSREGIDAVAQSPTLTVLARGGPSPRRALAVMRAHLASIVDAALPEPAAALLDGMVFGIPRPLPADLTTAMRDSGLAHVMAVSGLKVVLVAGLVASLCAALALSPRTRLVLTATTVGAYVLLAGAGPAAVRSALMAAAGWGLHGTGRIPDPLPLLAAVAAAMLMLDPGLVHDVGFQLSFLGTVGIVLLASPLIQQLPGPRLLREPFAMALAAQVVTLPVMAGAFGVVSLVGPLANALAVPLLPPVIAVAAAATLVSLPLPAVGVVPLQAAGLLAMALVAIARAAASLPGAALHVAAWPPVLVGAELSAAVAAALAWWAVRRRHRVPLASHTDPALISSATARGSEPTRAARLPSRPLSRPPALAMALAAAAAAGSTALLIGTRPDGRLHVAVLDVGAAVAVAVQARDGSHALVDTGTDPQRLLDSLGAALPPLTRSLDLLVLTGGERAAVGALPQLAGRYHINRVVAPSGGLAGAARQALLDLQRGGAQVDLVPPDAGWTWGGAAWRLLSPDGTADGGEALAVSDPTGSLLVVGGLDVNAQEELAALHGDALAADLLVAPASGSLAPTLAGAARSHLVAIPGAARGSRSTAALLLTGPGVRRTADAGTLDYTGGDGGLAAR